MSQGQTNGNNRLTLTADLAATEALARATEEVRLAREVLESKLSLLGEAAHLCVKSLQISQDL